MKLEELNPLSKFIFVLIISILVIFIKSFYTLLTLFILISTLILINGNLRPYLNFAFLAAPFLFTIWLINTAFVFCGKEVLNLYTWKLYEGGIFAGNVITLRVASIIVSSYIFTSTTNPRDLLQALVKYFKLNYSVALAAFIALRLLKESMFIISEFNQAYRARGLNPLSPSKFPSLIMVISFSILRKLFSIAISAESRGFGAYEKRIFRIDMKFTYKDYLFIFLAIIFLLISIYVGYTLNDLYIGLRANDFCETVLFSR